MHSIMRSQGFQYGLSIFVHFSTFIYLFQLSYITNSIPFYSYDIIKYANICDRKPISTDEAL